ncbi:MAG: hypothetical protein ACRDLZ_05775 [Gaiellaceae bacterium]
MPAVECPTCGANVPAEAAICGECGTPNPVAGVETRLRKYWSAPDLGLLVGLVLAGIGIVLLGAQVWLWAALALVLGAAVVLLRLDAGRRRTEAAVARLSTHRRVVGARSRGQLELFRLRRELAELQTERNQAYQRLGQATHAADADAARAATAHVDDVGVRILAKEGEIAGLLAEMKERVRQAQGEVAPTDRLEAPEPLQEHASGDSPPDPEHPSAPETERRPAPRASNT